MAADRAGSRNAGRFSPEQVAYLRALPAVATCDGRRIVFTDEFREHCLERYRQGALPTDLFREAGLDPELVGRKCISRAFGRWRRMAGLPPLPVGRPVKTHDADSADTAGVEPIDAVPAASVPSSHAGTLGDGDLKSLLLAQQAHYIASLEQRVADLERQLADCRRTTPTAV